MHVKEYVDAIFNSLRNLLSDDEINKIDKTELIKDVLFNIEKKVLPFGDLPLADRDRAWDGSGAESNIREWAGGKDNLDWAKYGKGFLWVNDEDREKFGSYKFPIADVIDGKLIAIPRGIFAAAGVLSGARLEGGIAQLDVPKGDIQGLKDHVDKYYAKMRKEWDDDKLVSPFKEKQVLEKLIDYNPMVPSFGKVNCEIAFVGASPGKIESIRGEPFVGPSGETFNELYLGPLGLKRDDIFLTNVVPDLLVDDMGNAREPTNKEISAWSGWLDGEIERSNPKVIVALGKIAKKALGEDVDFVLPHPIAIRKYSNSGEVGRKIKQIKLKLDEINKGLPSVNDVHVQSTNWKRPRRTQKSDNHYEGYADIFKADDEKHLIYGVVLEPGSVDAQNDTISAEEIERVAHVYLQNSRIVGNGHRSKAKADVVESFIAPINYEFGDQKITKGTWVMVVKVNDDKLWEGVKEKLYTGFSIGGFSKRILVNEPAN